MFEKEIKFFYSKEIKDFTVDNKTDEGLNSIDDGPRKQGQEKLFSKVRLKRKLSRKKIGVFRRLKRGK